MALWFFDEMQQIYGFTEQKTDTECLYAFKDNLFTTFLTASSDREVECLITRPMRNHCQPPFITAFRKQVQSYRVTTRLPLISHLLRHLFSFCDKERLGQGLSFR